LTAFWRSYWVILPGGHIQGSHVPTNRQYRNAFNIGLPILECANASEQIQEGHEIEVNIDTGVIQDLTVKKSLQAKSIPLFMQELIKDGGLMSYVSKRISK